MGPIGVFDSGYGGLTVLKEIVTELPQYDYIYLGDNARAPYGNRGFDTIHTYTLQCVQRLFDMGCPLVVLACNTASAKALRTIQQKDLPRIAPDNRVLGVIRPTTEMVGSITQSGEVGILATNGTVSSQSYPIEIAKFFPAVKVFQQACPMWVPLIENNEHEADGADYFVKEYLDKILSQSTNIDTLVLACTHYPLLLRKIRQHVPSGITVLGQGKLVARSLKDYLHRHPEMEQRLSKNGQQTFYTTDDPGIFDQMAEIFFGKTVTSAKIDAEKLK
ncbi:glutamate racemase [Chitinophaga jiangningensis]|uniref:Glutamate racemase n=1 Tax=Chitinophaga jiangningensis TaxID=1419482 RepID=A0A1M7GFS6_9BACT|nr:glutamate racemase [Chitinophaga jiangningensis]SHM14719.1 glutamate racemase [Chitinophaga jiangningensis]